MSARILIKENLDKSPDKRVTQLSIMFYYYITQKDVDHLECCQEKEHAMEKTY